MATEIERKFLISHIPDGCDCSMQIRQGYLQSSADRSVRIRVVDQQQTATRAKITIKGPVERGHFTRLEFEYDIPVEDARIMLQFCDHSLITKIRHHYTYAGNIWELDEFSGANQGLLLAEIELESENSTFDVPPFITQEVTGDPRYYNLNLAYTPFQTWPDKERKQP